MATSSNVVPYFLSPSLPSSTSSKALLVVLLSCSVLLFHLMFVVLCAIWRRRRHLQTVQFASPLSTVLSSGSEESLYESAV
jgi:hypothetical protein